MYSLQNCFTILVRKGCPLEPLLTLIDKHKIYTQNIAYRLHIASIGDILSVKGSVFMARTSNVFARVEPDIKEQAEAILAELGIPMSNAVGMFLRQIVMQRGIPFEMKLPASALLHTAISPRSSLLLKSGKEWRILRTATLFLRMRQKAICVRNSAYEPENFLYQKNSPRTLTGFMNTSQRFSLNLLSHRSLSPL